MPKLTEVYLMRSIDLAFWPKNERKYKTDYYLSIVDTSDQEPDENPHYETDGYGCEGYGGSKLIGKIQYTQAKVLVDVGVLPRHSLEIFDTELYATEVVIGFSKEISEIFRENNNFDKDKGVMAMRLHSDKIQTKEEIIQLYGPYFKFLPIVLSATGPYAEIDPNADYQMYGGIALDLDILESLPNNAQHLLVKGAEMLGFDFDLEDDSEGVVKRLRYLPTISYRGKKMIMEDICTQSVLEMFLDYRRNDLCHDRGDSYGKTSCYLCVPFDQIPEKVDYIVHRDGTIQKTK